MRNICCDFQPIIEVLFLLRTLNDDLVGTLRYYTKDTNQDRIKVYLLVQF